MTTFGDQVYQMGGVPVGGEFTTGSTFFVHGTTGSNSNDGKKPSTAFATIDYAIGQCTATKGDIVYAMPGHTETTATITCDVAGVSIIGLGRGSARPTVQASAGAVDTVNVTAANVYIENLKFVHGAATVAFININANDFTARNCWLLGDDVPLNFVTVEGGNNYHFDGCRFESLTDGPDTCIQHEATASNGWTVENCVFNFHASGLDEAVMESSFATSGGLFRNNMCIAMTLTMIDFNSSTDDGEGLIAWNACTFEANIAPADAVDPGGYGLIENYSTAAPAATGGSIPPTSDS